MRISKLLVTLAFSTLLGSGAVVASAEEDYIKGMEAHRTGDFKNSMKSLTLAAEQGHLKAQFKLGWMYRLGRGALENDKTAFKWLILAAEQGHTDAQYSVAYQYRFGEGVELDNKRAYMWSSIAAFNEGVDNSYKEDLRKIMTNKEISKAQEMASRCLESSYKDC